MTTNSNSPWSRPTDAPTMESLARVSQRDELFTLLAELEHVFHSHDVETASRVRISLALACIIACSAKRPEITESELKAVLQNYFDEAFHHVRNLMKDSSK